MATLLRPTPTDLTSAGRRNLRNTLISGWIRKIFVIAFLTAAMTAILARSLPLFRSSAIHVSLPQLSLNNTLLQTSERKINDLRADQFGETQEATFGVKSNVSGWRISSSIDPRMQFEPVASDNQRGEMNISTRSEIQFDAVKPSDDRRQVPASTSYKSHVGSLPPDEALIYAKKEIEGSLLIVADPDLYVPLFLNVSVFKRSYELMEKILKVYIYRDGRKPIFHTPELKGIYASEGWFMKLIEQNRHFVVKNPGQAHLFYLPYSARRMELALYVPDSHDMKPLSRFLRDYVNQISSKYPFWNRTRGSDHFLVACHDWESKHCLLFFIIVEVHTEP